MIMDEQNIPIDINTNKLLDWLISRHHINKDWQNKLLKIREKISYAIQDMPSHEEIIKLLSGQHINYFHCLKIIGILKETEADTKNVFGRYGSQRMKDWQDIVNSYQKDNIYLAEAAQIFVRNVNFEIPGLRKRISKLEQSQLDSDKEIKDSSKIENNTMKEFCQICEQLGIQGKHIKSELLNLLSSLSEIYEGISEKIKLVKPAVEFYKEFVNFLSSGKSEKVLTLLCYLLEKGNTTVYEYKYNKKPKEIENIIINVTDCIEDNIVDNNEIDFGDGDIDFGCIPVDNDKIDWEEDFEILTLDESDITVENSSKDDEDIAKGLDALTILDYPVTRNEIIDCLMELSAFLKMRIYEMSCESDLLLMSQMQDAPSILQMQGIESTTDLNHYVNVALSELLNKRNMHLHNIKHSPKYVDILTNSLKHKLTIAEKMRANCRLLEKKIKDTQRDIINLQNHLKLLIERTKQLQNEIQIDISTKYKDRPVHIVGLANLL